MLKQLNGATRFYGLIGDPIAQAMSPAGVTRALAARGRNAIVVPLHVAPSAVDALIESLGPVRNLDGLLATVPHKFTAYRHAATATDRGHALRAANILRRSADGSWHGDMLDGIAMVAAIRAAGCDPAGGRALLVGAGGAGSAIASGLLDAGVSRLAIHDTATQRRDTLIARLRMSHPDRLDAGSDDPAGFDLVVNATPAGMTPGDALPVITRRLTSRMFVADVVTKPLMTPLLVAALAAGCGIQTGAGMFDAELGLMVDFLLGSDA